MTTRMSRDFLDSADLNGGPVQDALVNVYLRLEL